MKAVHNFVILNANIVIQYYKKQSIQAFYAKKNIILKMILVNIAERAAIVVIHILVKNVKLVMPSIHIYKNVTSVLFAHHVYINHKLWYVPHVQGKYFILKYSQYYLNS